MKNNNYKIIRIISVVIIALLLAGSSISSFLHFKEKRDALLHQGINENKEESDYEPLPVPEETDIAEDITSPTDITLPSGLTSPSDVEPQPVETSPSRPLEEKMTIKYVKILDVTNVRKEDKADAEKVAVLNKGTEVEYVSESKTRYQVKYAGNKTGWVVKSCCEILEKEVIIKHVPTYVSGAPIDLKGTAAEAPRRNGNSGPGQRRRRWSGPAGEPAGRRSRTGPGPFPAGRGIRRRPRQAFRRPPGHHHSTTGRGTRAGHLLARHGMESLYHSSPAG